MPAGANPRALLERVLLLERSQGYQNRAAVGGLGPFSRIQLERDGAGSDPTLGRVALHLADYESQDRGRREAAVAAALSFLGSSVTSTPLPPAPASQPAVSPPKLERRVPPPEVRPPPVPAVLASRSKNRPEHSPEDLDLPLNTIKGVRKPTTEALGRLGVHVVRDLIQYFPRAHYDYTDTRSISRLRVGTKTTLVGTIKDVRTNYLRGKVSITTATVSDDTGTVAVRWFNQPYLTKGLPVGSRVAITGEPDFHGGRVYFVPRDYELIQDLELTHAARLVPVYGLTKGLYQRSLRALVRDILDEYVSALRDFVPGDIRDRHELLDLDDAVRQYHFPENAARRDAAQRRLAFNELLLIQLGLLIRKEQWREPDDRVAVPIDDALLARFTSGLPFPLTGAQQRVIHEILVDMASSKPMSRLLQGDVGSGKTVVAAAALLQCVRGGRQGMLMAPTEILAEQHFNTLTNILGPYDVRCQLLTGSMPKARNARYVD